MAQKASSKKATKKAPPKKPAASPKAVKKDAPKAAKTDPRTPSKKAAPAPKAPAPRPAPVKTSGSAPQAPKEVKKDKVQPLSKSDLQYFRNLLLERRREILGDVGTMENEAFKAGSNLSNMPIHMADVGTDNFEQEFTLGLIESERKILREIQEALIRIDNGTFGTCLGTGKLIPRVRLEAVPWAKHTVEYSKLLEAGKIDRDADNASDDDGEDDED